MECGRQRSKVKTLLLHHYASVLCLSSRVKTRVIRLQVIEGPNVRDQIAFCAFHSFLVEVQTNAGTHMRRMRNNNPEIRIAGSSCRCNYTPLMGR